MSIHSAVLDFLGQPRLLPLREKARAAHKLLVGTRSRARMKVSPGLVPGMLSIIVPIYGVEKYIGDCLESLLIQDYANIQVVVVDDGSLDRGHEIAAHYARRDPRVFIVRQSNGGLSAARNTGVSHARGEFLAFLDGDDFVDRHAYREAVEALRTSGSDFSVSPYRREKNGTLQSAAPWINQAHRVTRLGITLEEFPDIMVNAVAWSKVYRRRFWDANGFTFPVGLLYEDQAVSMAAYAAARTFDVLSRVSINWRIRGDQSSITQQVTSARNIADHSVAVSDSLSELERRGHSDVAKTRVQQILNNNLREFLPNVRQMDEVAWGQFRTFLTLLTDLADTASWDAVEARIKVMVGLCVSDERDLALRFLAEGGWERDHFAGTVHGDHLLADFPVARETTAILPKRAFRFSAAETALTAVARRIDTVDDVLHIDALAYINHLRMDREKVEIHCDLVHPDGRRNRVATTQRRDSWSAYGHTRRYADMAGSALTVTVPWVLLIAEGNYRVEFTMRCGDLQRTADLTVDGRTTFAVPTRVADRLFVGMESDSEGCVHLAVRRPAAELMSADIGIAHARIELLSGLDLTEAFLVHPGDRFALRRARTPLTRSEAGTYVGRIALPTLRGTKPGAREYALQILDRSGKSYRVTSSEIGAHARSSRLYLAPYLHGAEEESGGTTIVDLDRSALVSDVRLEASSLLVSLRDEHCPRVVSARSRVGSSEVVVDVERDPSLVHLRIPMRQNPWGLGDVGLPSGRHDLVGVDRSGQEVSLYLDAALVARLPLELNHSTGRMIVRRSSAGLLRMDLQSPLRDEERGSGDRWRMRDWSAGLRPSAPRSVLFRNLYGESANDSALAVHRELRRRGSELELLWAVRDFSVWVPEGGRPVLENSREYYEAFGSADYVMVNVHQPDWYRKPPGQVLIETFHGYPFKMNGRDWWKKLGFSPERQESFFRRAEEWDYLVSPAQYATPILQQFYREDAAPATEILQIGYPRNDALIDDGAAALRADTRRRLGIPADKKVILYAPTFRDYVSGDDMTAEMVEFFDPDELMRQLGPGYVLLLRGHPFNARLGTNRSAQFVNVTDYPDINHLMLASDLGVLDYSSARFDYALTGKPTFYFVPDLERYFEGREGFVPYDDTSPGPHVRNLVELVDGIRDAEAVGEDFEQARRRFVSTFMELEDGRAASRLVDAVFAPRSDV